MVLSMKNGNERFSPKETQRRFETGLRGARKVGQQRKPDDAKARNHDGTLRLLHRELIALHH
jgi:hypothetical protein